jgi:hypothetical protein
MVVLNREIQQPKAAYAFRCALLVLLTRARHLFIYVTILHQDIGHPPGMVKTLNINDLQHKSGQNGIVLVNY